MPVPNLFLLYVEDPQQSAAFYAKLFEREPDAKFETFASFDFPGGPQIGLWSTKAKNFVSGGTGHRSEIALAVNDEEQVRQLHDKWQKLGVAIEQPLHKAVFGLTFVALDPDGHRIRVCLRG